MVGWVKGIKIRFVVMGIGIGFKLQGDGFWGVGWWVGG